MVENEPLFWILINKAQDCECLDIIDVRSMVGLLFEDQCCDLINKYSDYPHVAILKFTDDKEGRIIKSGFDIKRFYLNPMISNPDSLDDYVVFNINSDDFDVRKITGQLYPFIKYKAEHPQQKVALKCLNSTLYCNAFFFEFIKKLNINTFIIPATITPTNLSSLCKTFEQHEMVSSASHSLTDFRDVLKDLDVDILNLVAERIKIIRKIGTYKQENNLSFFDPERFGVMLRLMKNSAMTLNLDPVFIEELYTELQIQSLTEMLLQMYNGNSPSGFHVKHFN
jgi:chorismate mutase